MTHRAWVVNVTVAGRIVESTSRASRQIIERDVGIFVAILESLERLLFEPFIAREEVVCEDSPVIGVLHRITGISPVTHTAVPYGRQRVVFRITPRKKFQVIAGRRAGGRASEISHQRAEACAIPAGSRGVGARESFLRNHAVEIPRPNGSPRL